MKAQKVRERRQVLAALDECDEYRDTAAARRLRKAEAKTRRLYYGRLSNAS